MKFVAPLAGLAMALFAATPAAAVELFAGGYVHDLKTPLDKSGIEQGADLLFGVRGGGIMMTPIQPYGFVAVNTSGKTSYGAIGVSAKFGDKLYVRPGFGLAVHTGSAKDYSDPTNGKIDFGSRLLFEPELAIGLAIAPRTSIEASWIHMSHATLFSRQNPGIDNIGVRVNLAL